jgi:hypothetical protein
LAGEIVRRGLLKSNKSDISKGSTLICPKCQTDPPEGGKFCKECGQKIELACPECGKNILTLAIEMSQKIDFAGVLLSSFANLALLNITMGKYQEAQECYDSLLAVYERVRISPSVARVGQISKVAAEVRGRLNPARWVAEF